MTPATDDISPALHRRLAQQLDDLCSAGRAPGLQYIVVTADRVLFEHAAGWADIGRQRPMDMETTLMTYSMSKTFTAVAVLQLVESGAVQVDESMARYISPWPYDRAITIRQVLSHTAGIPNPLPLRWVHAAARHPGFDDSAALEKILAKHSAQSDRPGRRYAYSNIGYWLLGRLVERVRTETFAEYMRVHVFNRLGPPASALGYAIPDAGRHARGYLERWSFLNLCKSFVIDRTLIGDTTGGWVNIRDHHVDGNAFGGIVGSLRGVAAFLQDQLRPASVLLTPDGCRLLCEQQRVSNGSLVPMTLAWHVAQVAGQRVLYKEGGGGGFHGLMRLYPDAGFGAAVLTNATGINVHRVMNEIDQPFLDTR